MTAALKTVWKLTLGPVYERLFRRYFDATVSRLDTVIAQGSDISSTMWHHIHGLNLRLDELNARVADLEAHVSAAAAARWDETAVIRRLALLEDRAAGNGTPAQPKPSSTDA
jgi:hypothetical protein